MRVSGNGPRVVCNHLDGLDAYQSRRCSCRLPCQAMESCRSHPHSCRRHQRTCMGRLYLTLVQPSSACRCGLKGSKKANQVFDLAACCTVHHVCLLSHFAHSTARERLHASAAWLSSTPAHCCKPRKAHQGNRTIQTCSTGKHTAGQFPARATASWPAAPPSWCAGT